MFWDEIKHEGWLWLVAGALALIIVVIGLTVGQGASGHYGINSVVGFIDPRFKADNPNQNVIGSGVIIDGLHVVTAAHVVSDDAKVGSGWRLKFTDGSIHNATLEAFDAKLDVAVLKLTEVAAGWSPLACDAPAEVGQPIVVRGYPVDLGLVTTKGYIVRLNTGEAPWFIAPYWPEGFLLTDAGVTYGNSGGPAYDERGRVLGILVGIIVVPVGPASSLSTQLAVVIEASVLCDFVNSYLDFQAIEARGNAAIEAHKKALTPPA